MSPCHSPLDISPSPASPPTPLPLSLPLAASIKASKHPSISHRPVQCVASEGIEPWTLDQLMPCSCPLRHSPAALYRRFRQTHRRLQALGRGPATASQCPRPAHTKHPASSEEINQIKSNQTWQWHGPARHGNSSQHRRIKSHQPQDTAGKRRQVGAHLRHVAETEPHLVDVHHQIRMVQQLSRRQSLALLLG